MSFWTLDNDQTVGYLRHAEIKHGRVAMAAFLGDCVQCLGVVKGEHTFLPYCGYVADVSPQEQWDNIPVIGKLQILTFVGMLESYGEIPGDVPHYTAPGGLRATTRDQGQPPGDPLRPLQAVRPRVAGIITLADIAYLPLMRCRQLLTWFVTARQPAGVLVCAWT